MSQFIDVVRAEDLLVLRFELVNLVVEASAEGRARRIVRAAPGLEARLVVHFPPQHVAEECLPADADGRVEGLVAASDDRVRARLAGGSRLAFRVPDEVTSIPLTLDGLLAWHRLEPALALDPDAPAFDEPSVRTPTGGETSIEMPYRVQLSPGRHDGWFHSPPLRQGRRSELWHTRLGPLGSTQAPGSLVRAVWSPDLDEAGSTDPFRLSLRPRQRAELVRLSSDFRILARERFGDLSEEQAGRIPVYRPVPLRAERLALSALGGWLRAKSRFQFPRLDRDLQAALLDRASGPPFGLTEWEHDLAMGRDLSVRVVGRGWLYPLGHEAHVVTVSRRRLSELAESHQNVAFLEQVQWLAVVEKERTYPVGRFPFRKVRIATETTPPLGTVDTDQSFVPESAGRPFAFAVQAVDHVGRELDLRLPLVFVPAQSDLGAARDEYRERQLGRVPLACQPLAFAPDERGTGMTSLMPERLDLDDEPVEEQGGPGFQPVLSGAAVHLPAVQHLLGGERRRLATEIRYHPAYARGVGPDGVFARMTNPLALSFPADKVGGLAAPSLLLRDLSARHGALPDLQKLDAKSLREALQGRLLGVIDLAELVEAAGDVSSLPRVAVQDGPDRQHALFEWRVPLKSTTAPFLTEEGSILDLKGRVSRARQGGEPSTDVQGTVSRFTLSLAGVVRVRFDWLRFHMATGRRTEFGAKVDQVEFEGDLRWLQELSAVLEKHAAGLQDAGASLSLTPAGIAASLSVPVPSVSFGILNVMDLLVSATLRLFFDERPAELQLGLCSPERPFLVSYSVFGGGGSLQLTVSTGSGSVDLRASLEFGAVAAVDLKLAKGVAQVMVGVRFSLKAGALAVGAQLRIHGSVEVLGLVSISVDLVVSMTFEAQGERKRFVARGDLVVQVRVLGFARSVRLEVERAFDLAHESPGPTPEPGPRPIARLGPASHRLQWESYCQAFA